MMIQYIYPCFNTKEWSVTFKQLTTADQVSAQTLWFVHPMEGDGDGALHFSSGDL